MKLSKNLIVLIIILILTTTEKSYSSEDVPLVKQQSQTIIRVLNAEKNKIHANRIYDIINRIDQTYSNLYENLQNGNRLVIFFDPAHGLLPNGRWQGGDATHRTSCTNLPEEYYSIKISRMLYGLLKKNNFIAIRTTDDFLSVLEGDSELYYDIPFTKTVELAEKAKAFIIISEHLNNISILYKADGRINLPGIHITRNRYGWRVLQHVKDTYSGFLTLYNKLDASGFSLDYAMKLKNMLVSQGLKPNSWNFGAVGDTRFCYFVDFPVSVIYESGFISNPEEEKNLRDPDYIKKIVTAQYDALMETIKEIYGVDISGSSVNKIGETDADRIELFKLARLSVYYIKVGNTSRAIQIIREMENQYSGKKFYEYASFYTLIKNSLISSCRYYAIAQRYKRENKYKLARNYFWLARRSLYRAPIFSALHERYHRELASTVGASAPQDEKLNIVPVKSSYNTLYAVRAPLGRSIIFPVEQKQNLETSIELALEPNPETMKKLVKSFKNASRTIRVKVAQYSQKKQKDVYVWKTASERVKFIPGIYIVRLDKNLNVISAKYVNSAVLNPWQYQNQQYLKNSYFAHDTKDRSL